MEEQHNMSEDAFLKALEKNKKRKEEEEAARQGGNYEFGETFFDAKKMNLKTGEESVFRIVGKPYEVRSEPTDTKLVFHSRIVNDKGRYSHIIWPTTTNDEGLPELDRDWVMFQVLQKVTEGSYRDLSEDERAERVDKAKSIKVYSHEGTKSFEWVNGNKAKNNKYPPKFGPKKRVIMNVIDRHDDWCKENKKTKLAFTGLGYGKAEDGSDIEFINDVGIPLTAYNAIMESVVAFTKHWDLDIVMKRTKDVNNAYEIRDISEKKISKRAQEIGTDAPLTDEEKEYEKWDIDYLFRPTSYSKLLRVFGGKLKLVDAELGTDFHALVKAKAEQEKKELEANKEKEESTSSKKEDVQKETEPEVSEEVDEEDIESEEPLATSRRERSRASESEEEVKDKDPMDFIKQLPNYDKLDEIDLQDVQEHIKDVKDGVPVWSDTGLQLLKCDNKDCHWPDTDVRTSWPNSVLHCAVCGVEYNQAK